MPGLAANPTAHEHDWAYGLGVIGFIGGHDRAYRSEKRIWNERSPKTASAHTKELSTNNYYEFKAVSLIFPGFLLKKL